VFTRSATLVLLAGLVGCSNAKTSESSSDTPASEGTSTMQLTSSAFGPNEEIDAKYTCEGADVSPPLSWSGAPEGTKSFALIVDDPDAPDPKAPKRVWVHWVVCGIPASTHELAEGASTALPAGAKNGTNDWGKQAWGGPCPPIGRHRYFHKVYALDTELELDAPDKKALEAAMAGHILAQGELIGTYQKSGS
jgi:Raf kinase inhibitor-like YbhB/YbcL family protein